MYYKYFLHGIIDIILNPIEAWVTIDSEKRSVRFIRERFLFPLIILVSISAFLGSLIFINSELSPVYSIFAFIKCFGLLFFTIYSTAFVFSEITYPLDLGKNFTVSFKIILYSAVPFCMCQIMSLLFESLLFVNIIGLYGLYIFWTGAEKMLSPPQYKKMPLLIATTVTFTVIYIITNFLLTKLTDRIYYAYFT
jgi:hypothetical protein